MIKTGIFLLLLTSGILTKSEAQKALPVPVEFSNVVVADSLAKLDLFHNAVHWTNSLKANDEKVILTESDSIAGKVLGESSFFVYTQSGILKKVSGLITYKLSVEVKDNKYRYQLSNFVFHYYKQDRNYNMVETGKTKPLEELKATGWQKLWTQHRATVLAKMKASAQQLELKMIEKPKKITAEKKVKKVEW
ncbi:MAG: DUF4468 domain-containing protein [Bacteroidetes bacterium]|nr:DUF4468 domain-containing protein [Bacteroidota bacterium]